MGKVGQGQAYRVLRMDKRVKVRIGNRKVMDMKQGSWKQKWDKGEQGSEFWYGVTQSVTEGRTPVRSMQGVTL